MPHPATPSPTAEAAVRAHFGLSQQELASYLGVSAGLVAHFEAGLARPAPAALARLTALALLLPPPEGHGPPAPLAPAATPANPAALPEGPATRPAHCASASAPAGCWPLPSTPSCTRCKRARRPWPAAARG